VLTLLRSVVKKASKYALALCDALSEDSELAGSCYKSTKEVKSPPPLPWPKKGCTLRRYT